MTSVSAKRGSPDVVIVGAGIIGLSIALQIANRSRLKVEVFEKAPAVGEGSTGASSAVCRHRYSSDEMVRIATAGITAYKKWRAFTGLSQPKAVFHEDGVLWLPGSDQDWSGREAARLNGLGVSAEVLDADDISRIFPSLSSCSISPDLITGESHACNRGSIGMLETGGGYVEPVDATQDLVDACRAAGVSLRFRSAVTGLRVRNGQFSAVELENGDTVSAGTLVNATGPWCSTLNVLAGLAPRWQLDPVRIQVLVIDRSPELRGHIPVTADIGAGIYFRTQNQGNQLVISTVREEDEQELVSNPENFSRVPDHEFQYINMHALSHRLPDLSDRGSIRGYCGLYTINRDDALPVVGPTEIKGYWVANGFSGHGFKIAPAIGSMLAKAISGSSGEFDCDVDSGYLVYDRRPVTGQEMSVIA